MRWKSGATTRVSISGSRRWSVRPPPPRRRQERGAHDEPANQRDEIERDKAERVRPAGAGRAAHAACDPAVAPLGPAAGARGQWLGGEGVRECGGGDAGGGGGR